MTEGILQGSAKAEFVKGAAMQRLGDTRVKGLDGASVETPVETPVDAPVVKRKRGYQIPPSMPDPRFRREPGQPGRPPVYHNFLLLVGRRLRSFRSLKDEVPLCWHRLQKFPEEVLFLTIAGYSPHYICKVFKEHLPNLYPTLSPEGVEYSVNRIMIQAREGTVILGEDLRNALRSHKAGPWGSSAEEWMKEQYWAEQDSLSSRVGRTENSSLDDSGNSSGKVSVETRDCLVKAPGESSEPTHGLDLEASASPGILSFLEEWTAYGKLKPSVGEPTDEEVEIGMLEGLSAVLAFRRAKVESDRVVTDATTSAPEIDRERGTETVAADVGFVVSEGFSEEGNDFTDITSEVSELSVPSKSLDSSPELPPNEEHRENEVFLRDEAEIDTKIDWESWSEPNQEICPIEATYLGLPE